MGQLIVIVAMFALLWLLLIRPQRRRQVEQQQLQSSIEVGDEVLTVGGLYAHVRELLDDDDLLVEIAPGTNVRLARRAIAGVVEEDDADEEDVAAAAPVEERAGD
ncbi:MAG TPA: preprotein translocase subunit YajC [Gaiellaceae bacterium]|nr:preprotein translocase subunit YajC [Gaiellaceae bacterium]